MGTRRKEHTEGEEGEELAPQGAELDLDAYFAKARTDTARAERPAHKRRAAAPSLLPHLLETVREGAVKAYDMARKKIHSSRANKVNAKVRPQLPPDLVAIVLLSFLLVVAGIFFKP